MYEPFLGVNPWTALLTLINTLLIYFVGKRYLFEPVSKIIAQRKRQIDDTYFEANAAKTSAMAMEREYREKLYVAAAEAEQLRKDAVSRAEKTRTELLNQAKAEAFALRQREEEQLIREKEKAMEEAKGEVGALALAIAERIIGRELNKKDHGALVEDFLREWEAAP